MSYSVAKTQLSPQPVLALRRQVKSSEIPQALAEMFPQVFLYAQQNGLTLAGPPYARYLAFGPGVMTLEAGIPVTAPAPAPPPESGILVDTLPGGSAAVTTHAGPYDQLPGAHVAVQQWIAAQGLVALPGPWESYITDPADYPDPKDWKTVLFFPLKG